MKHLSAIALLSLLTAGVATAQLHPNGYAVGGAYNGGDSVFIVDAAGTTVYTISTGGGNVHGMVMDEKNELLVIANFGTSPNPETLLKVDPATGATVGTFGTFPNQNIRDIVVGQNGNYYVSSSTLTDTIFKVDLSGNTTTLVDFGLNPYGGMDICVDTADILVQTRTGDSLYRLSRDGTTITTLGSGMDALYGISKHIPTGDVYIGSCCGTSAPPIDEVIYQLPAGSSVATLWLAGLSDPRGLYCLKCDRASAVTQQLVCAAGYSGTYPTSRGIYKVDIATKGVTKLTSLDVAASAYEIEILYRRNVSSYATGTGTWDIPIHIPEDSDENYVMAVGASGVRPGVTFGSGRTAFLNPDTITFVGLSIGLAPFVTGAAGTLSGSGKAVAKLDVSSLPPAANGTKLWFLVVTLDAGSPDGLKTITDPHVIRIEGL